MTTVNLTLLGVLLMLVSCLLTSRPSGAVGVPLCGCAAAQGGSQDCGLLYQEYTISVANHEEGNASEKVAERSEVYRLFGDGRDTDCEFRHLAKKAVLMTPLLGQYNGLQLMMRPPSDIYTTYGKRYYLHKTSKLPPIAPPPGDIAVDLHMHTCYSHDSLSDPRLMLMTAHRRGLSGVAITDHDTLAGGLRAVRLAREMIANGELPSTFFVIPGEEISSQSGHILGLFLVRNIPSGMSAAETIKAIHAQNGIAIAAHPLYPGDGIGVLAKTLPFDLVETENAAETLQYIRRSPAVQQQRAQFYAGVTKPRTGGGDAHDPGGIGITYTQLTCASTLADVRAELLAGRTTAVTRFTDDQVNLMAHKGFPSFFMGVRDSCETLSSRIGAWLCNASHATESRVTMYPSPGFSVSRRF